MYKRTSGGNELSCKERRKLKPAEAGATRASEGEEAFLDAEGADEDGEAGADALRAGHHRLLVRQHRHGGAHAPEQEPGHVPVHAAAARSYLRFPSAAAAAAPDRLLLLFGCLCESAMGGGGGWGIRSTPWCVAGESAWRGSAYGGLRGSGVPSRFRSRERRLRLAGVTARLNARHF